MPKPKPKSTSQVPYVSEVSSEITTPTWTQSGKHIVSRATSQLTGSDPNLRHDPASNLSVLATISFPTSTDLLVPAAYADVKVTSPPVLRGVHLDAHTAHSPPPMLHRRHPVRGLNFHMGWKCEQIHNMDSEHRKTLLPQESK
ncbi:FAD dependent oxidoreductase [Marssonina coronariae]|uniref:FAD dependent oxidoreductase n=1 Tax=Diplocarpon coronariae TaxID=2795749 RepID=A0A218Z6I8_9HELO|nr:FAD dependent oxidoreductase [Marssonina coronariae]